MKSFSRQVTRLLCLALTSFFCSAQADPLALRFDSSGLKSLRWGATELLASGLFEVNAVQFAPTGSRAVAGSMAHTTASDPNTRTTRIKFDWGNVVVRYLPQGPKLLLDISTTNGSRLPLTALSYQALTLKLQSRPREYDGVTPLLATNIGGPTVLPLTSDLETVTLCNEDAQRPLLVGFPWALDRPLSRTFPLRITTGREPMYPDSLPTIERPIPPGGTDRFLLSLRLTSARADVASLAPDIYQLFRKMDPFTVNWPDRRPIGSLIIGTAAAGWAKNPRGWLLDPKLDITTPQGVALFQARLLAWADRSVAILKSIDAQGMVTWDAEGEQFPHATTYIGDPRLVETLAPEMRGVIDEYFARFRRAGLRVGMTIRPQMLVISPGGATAKQIAADDPAQVLIDKIAYAKKRWGATLFYIDSNGDPALPLAFSTMRKVADAFPDVLLMPEHKNAAYYSKTAPYGELRGGYASTPALARGIYGRAFSVINTADGGIEAHAADLQRAFAAGDIAMFRAWYDDPANTQLKMILRGQGVGSAPKLPHQGKGKLR